MNMFNAMKLFKFFLAILLFPLCISSSITLYEIMSQSFFLSYSSDNSIFFLIGISLCLSVFYFIPKPIRIYVLGHELTHALWAITMGKKVLKIKVTKKGGHVEVSKSNFWISLSPYFFPFYTFVWIIISLIIYYFFNNLFNEKIFYLFIGLTWMFHFLFMIEAMKIRQTDITQHGIIFSYLIIYFMNILFISLGLVFFFKINFLDFINIFSKITFEVYIYVIGLFKRTLKLLVQFP